MNESDGILPFEPAIPDIDDGAARPPSAPDTLAPLQTAKAPARERLWIRLGRETVVGVQTLVSAAVYATLIVTFGVQVARVDGMSMAPTLEDHDRLIVNKLVYELGEPRPGDIVMLYYPLDPEKMFVKRVIAKEGDRCGSRTAASTSTTSRSATNTCPRRSGVMTTTARTW